MCGYVCVCMCAAFVQNDGEGRLSKLQASFFTAKFGDDAVRIRSSKPTNKMEKKLRRAMKDNFANDAAVLKYILTDVMDPGKNGQFKYNLANNDDEDKAAEEGASQPEGYEWTETCPVPGCGSAQVVPSLHVCENHTQHEQLERFQQNWAVVELLRSQECLRHILNVFSTADHEAHGYAIRVIWCLFRGTYNRKGAADQFSQYLSIYCSGPKFNKETKNALLALLLSDPEEVPAKLEERAIMFFIPVKQWFTWRALFECLKESDFSIRKQALQVGQGACVCGVCVCVRVCVFA